jgi:hypothetical protein
MKRILLLTLTGTGLLIPSLKAQDVTIGPGGVTIERHQRHYYNSDEYRARQRQREYWRERRLQQERWDREGWQERFYERHGYWPPD